MSGATRQCPWSLELPLHGQQTLRTAGRRVSPAGEIRRKNAGPPGIPHSSSLRQYEKRGDPIVHAASR
jgi:hypothetical protein